MHNDRSNRLRLNSHFAPSDNQAKWGTTHVSRGNDILVNVPSKRASKNMTEATLRALRLYKRYCRLVSCFYNLL